MACFIDPIWLFYTPNSSCQILSIYSLLRRQLEPLLPKVGEVCLTLPASEPQIGRMQLLRLSLTDFRTYATLSWRPRARITVLFGPNGRGKTNLLEAVSLLVPGRGLRSARTADLRRHGAAGGRGGGGGFAPAPGAGGIRPRTPPRG